MVVEEPAVFLLDRDLWEEEEEVVVVVAEVEEEEPAVLLLARDLWDVRERNLRELLEEEGSLTAGDK